MSEESINPPELQQHWINLKINSRVVVYSLNCVFAMGESQLYTCTCIKASSSSHRGLSLQIYVPELTLWIFCIYSQFLSRVSSHSLRGGTDHYATQRKVNMLMCRGEANSPGHQSIAICMKCVFTQKDFMEWKKAWNSRAPLWLFSLTETIWHLKRFWN